MIVVHNQGFEESGRFRHGTEIAGFMHSQSVEVQFTFRTDFFFSNSNHHTKYHTKQDLFLSKSAKIKLKTKADSVLMITVSLNVLLKMFKIFFDLVVIALALSVNGNQINSLIQELYCSIPRFLYIQFLDFYTYQSMPK